jgi:2'-5' RNA ligase
VSVRLFVAVSPPKEVRAHLAAALTEVPGLLAGARPVRPDQWHLTLAFLDEVADEGLPGVRAAVAEAASGSGGPLTLRLAGAGTFGGHRGVAWVGLGGDVDRLKAVARTLQTGLRAAGVLLESRPYRPHLTIARQVDTRRRPAAEALAALSGYAGPPWTARTLDLVHSSLGAGPGGSARHETVGVWEL